MISENSWPFVSIVIPALNAGGRLRLVLEACVSQRYQGDWEIILVDNASTDNTLQIASEFPTVKVLSEAAHANSPYSARNRGIEVARGEIIALTDASCVPRPDWLAEGVLCFRGEGIELVAGNVVFAFDTDKPRAGAVWDSITNVQQELAVASGKAKTGNLFVKAELFKTQGLFKEGVRSGEDVRWTSDTTAAGKSICFAANAVVQKPTRDLKALLKKAARTGSGKAGFLSLGSRISRGLASLVVPPWPPRVVQLVRSRSALPVGAFSMVTIWFVAWAVRLAHGAGILMPGMFMHAD